MRQADRTGVLRFRCGTALWSRRAICGSRVCRVRRCDVTGIEFPTPGCWQRTAPHGYDFVIV